MKIRARIKAESFQPNNDEGILRYQLNERKWLFNNQEVSIYRMEILSAEKEIQAMRNSTTEDSICCARVLVYMDEEQAIKEAENNLKQ